MLPQILYLASKSLVVAVWPDEERALGRAWCIAEAAIHQVATGRRLAIAAGLPLAEERSHILPRPGEEALENETPFILMKAHNETAIRGLITEARRSGDPADLACWLSRRTHCTNAGDMRVISAAIVSAAASLTKIGWQAATLRAVEVFLKGLWWTLGFPALLGFSMLVLLLKAMGPLFVGNRSGVVKEGGLSWWILLPLFIVIFIIINAVVVLVLGVVHPLELARRFISDKILKQRADFMSIQYRSDKSGT
ncbi:MAG: hypothetical protein WAM82_09005 [Thermoanaerobaculia bacterium]